MSQAIVKRVALRGAAQALMKCRDPEVLAVGPAGTGKSFGALYKIHLMMLKNPGARSLVLRKTLRSLTTTGLVTFREQVAKEALTAGIVNWYGGSSERPAQYTYSNGSVIVVGGMDNPDKVMSAEYDACFAQEATDLTREDWEKISSRLRNGVISFQQLIADCNPQQPKHWLKQRCDSGATTMLYSKHADNPRLYADDGQLTEYGQAYIRRLESLTGVRRLRLLEGKWAAAEGLIYEDWDPSVHVVDALPAGSERWRRIWSVDFGFVHPFVWQQWAIDPDGRMYLELEIFKTKTLVEDHAKAILALVAPGGVWRYPKPHAVICDHDAEDRATLEKHLGMGTVAAKKTVSDGIQAVQARLRDAGDGRRRLYVLRNSNPAVDAALRDSGRPVCFEDEIEGYVWEQTPDGRPDKDQPHKDLDDSVDCARYAVAHEDLAGKAGLRGWL